MTKSDHKQPHCSPSHGQQLLLRLILDSQADVAALWRQWTAKYELSQMEAGTFHLLPLVYQRLSQYDIEPEGLGILNGVYKRSWFNNIIVLRNGYQAIELFNSSHIPCIVIKGMGLLSLYQNNPALRPMFDIDILVPRDKVEHAIQLLIENGWRPHWGVSGKLLSDVLVSKCHSWGFIRNGKDMDLHWHALHQAQHESADDDVWKHSRVTQVLGRDVTVPSATEQLLHTILHGIRPGSSRLGAWVIDAVYILQQNADDINWSRFLQQVSRLHLQVICFDALSYLVNHFPLSIPDYVMQNLQVSRYSKLQWLEYRAITNQVGSQQILCSFAKGYMKQRRQENTNAFSSLLTYMMQLSRDRLEVIPGNGYAAWPLIRKVFSYLPRLRQYCEEVFPAQIYPEKPDWKLSSCPLDTHLYFNQQGEGSSFAVLGWSEPESTHIWSNQHLARLCFEPAVKENIDLCLSIRMHPYLPPSCLNNVIDIVINHRFRRQLRFTHNQGEQASYKFDVRAEELGSNGGIDILFFIRHNRSPLKAEQKMDCRSLGLCLHWMKISEYNSP